VSIRLTKLLLAGAGAAAVAIGSPAVAQDASEPAYSPIDGSETPTSALSGTIDPFYGSIDPFYGTLNPFYGDIGAFYGSINPFYGDIGAFWGDIGAFYGSIDPFYGSIDPFYGSINPFNENALSLSKIGNYWQDFGKAWEGSDTLWSNPLLGSALVLKMNTVITSAELTWGASIQAQTGKSFREAFLNPLFARYGINPNNASSMQKLTATQRSQFFLDWYDGLMRYSGTDRVDHWMRTVNWTPAITQQQGSGADTIIGLLDATATGDPDIANNVAWSGGYNTTVGGHGVGVASLMVAAHDREGVMGVAPNATVIAYNPFDSTNSASWSAVRAGILSLSERGASIINMSLGVPGYTLSPDWRKVFFDPAIYAATQNRVFVMAAGNDGRVQTQNVQWDFAHDPNLIIVGSTRVDGTISSFSNTPGNACLLNGNVCQDYIMNRYIVAPGELILLPDGQGGFVRRNGTSFAAPIVSGAIALLHDRWPWLARYPHETVDIILQSARDLGAPGVDPVYGHGMLDIQASQSPLNYNNLQFYEVRNGVMTARTAANLRLSGAQTTWETDGVYFQLYEPIGATYRDFTVPMSSHLSGQVRTLTGALEYYQRFAQRGLTDWINHGSNGFTDMNFVDMPTVAGLRLGVTASRPEAYLTDRQGGPVPLTALRFSDEASGLAFTAGYGNGAVALNGQQGLAMSSDHSRDGGANPLLALAAGGPFANVDLPLSRSTTLSFGVTQDRQVRYDSPFQDVLERAALQGIEPLHADALNLRITHRPAQNVVLSGTYSRIREHNGLLGVQSRELTDFGHGATSETATVSASLSLRGGYTLAASGTLGRTRTLGGPEQGFVTEGEGVTSTAFALSATRQGLLGRNDALRIAVSQPLHIERGNLAYRSVGVVDRETGELGVTDQPFEANGDRRTLIGEMLYETPILSGNGEIGLFGRAEFVPQGNVDINQFAVGSRFTVRF